MVTKKKTLKPKRLVKEESAMVVMDCVQMVNYGEWKKLTPGFCSGADEKLVLVTDKN